MTLHPLEEAYQLTAYELLDALQQRFRARVALEGAVAEVHLERHIRSLLQQGVIAGYESHDRDGYPDFTITTLASRNLTVECKNVRDAKEGYRRSGEVIAYKVQTQKTRAATGDPSSRFYDIGYFDILAVCLGKKSGDWTKFLYAWSHELRAHADVPGKLAAMQRVPIVESEDQEISPWVRSLTELKQDI